MLWLPGTLARSHGAVDSCRIRRATAGSETPTIIERDCTAKCSCKGYTLASLTHIHSFELCIARSPAQGSSGREGAFVQVAVGESRMSVRLDPTQKRTNQRPHCIGKTHFRQACGFTVSDPERANANTDHSFHELVSAAVPAGLWPITIRGVWLRCRLGPGER